MKNIEERIEALERSSRRYRAIAVILAFTLIAVGLVAARGSGGARDVVSCKKIEILDDEGNARIMLGVTTLKVGKASTIENKPVIVMYDEEGKVRSLQVVADYGKVAFELLDDNEIPRIGMYAKESKAAFVLAAGEERSGIMLVAKENGAALEMRDEKRFKRFTVGYFSNRAEMSMEDAQGNERLSIFIGETSIDFKLEDNEGKTVFRAP